MPEKKKRRLTTVCTICNGPSASHLHYGAVACYSCRAFFRRGIGKPYCCVEGTGDCGIDWTNRRSCQWCRFDRCLKAGMKPELVDATFRRKSFTRPSQGQAAVFEEPTLIDNFRPLERDDISDFLQDIAGGGGSHQAQDSGGLYYLETADPASAAAAPVDIFNLSYIGPAGAGAGAGVSPSYSLPLSPSSSSYSEYSDPGAGQGAGQQCYTININIADIESQIFSLPESLYQTEPELSHLETSFNALNTVDQGEAGPGDSDEEEDSDCVNNSFDIEALVDECFMNETNVQ